MPTGPHSVPQHYAKFILQEHLRDTHEQRRNILIACDHSNIPVQDAIPCPSDDKAWLLYFRTVEDLHSSLGRFAIVRNVPIPVLTYAPGRSFQIFAIRAPKPLSKQKGEIDTINAVARTFRTQKFVIQRQKKWRDGVKPKWIVVFEEPLNRDSFVVDMTISGRREPLNFFALASDATRCWVCLGEAHRTFRCHFAQNIKVPHRDSQYLSSTPTIKGMS